MKDNFSKQADLYAQYRPSYPQALIDHVVSLAPNRGTAWDVATGNGQVAQLLAPHFRQVIATDISERQLAHAPALPNVEYRLSPAEKTGFPDHGFDLVTIGQAIHWFDHGAFNAEVQRVIRPGGIVAAFGYPLVQSHSPLDEVIWDFYENTIGKYWDEERRHIDDGYQRIPFPFERIVMPRFEISYDWTFEQLSGHFRTWSAVQHYLLEHGEHPVDAFEPALRQAWGVAERRTFVFEILTMVGRG